MKKNYLTKNITVLLVLITLIILGFYTNMILSLPLFGDATIHADISKKVLLEGSWNSVREYPSHYFILQAILYSFFGEKGLNSIVIIGLVLISFFSYLLFREVLNDKLFPFIATLLILLSPKLIFYSARMYMEIIISGFFLVSIYFLIKFMKSSKDKMLYFCFFFIAITSIIKQQGLFVLMPSITLFLLFYFISKKQLNRVNIQKLLLCGSLFLAIIILPYINMAHNTGKIIPGNEDILIINKTNNIIKEISNYKETPATQIDNIIIAEKEKFYRKGTKRAEARHIKPLTIFTDKNRFLQANGLFLKHFAGGYTTRFIENLFFMIFIIGCILTPLIKKNKTKISEYIGFIIIFLLINYPLFIRNTDQMRYHLFIPFLLVIFYIIPFYAFRRILSSKKVKIIGLFLLIVLLTNLFPIFVKDINFNKRWDHSQIYSPSKGGINSIITVGYWLKNNTQKSDKIFMACGNELRYYSRRDVSGTPFIYFLNNTQLDNYFIKKDYKYIIIFDSQLVDDKKWSNLCWVPLSYKEKIEKLYPLIYESPYKDIYVYRVNK